MQQRLEQTVSEVTRLRNERTRLMDVGNELRAALNRVQNTLPHHIPLHTTMSRTTLLHSTLSYPL